MIDTDPFETLARTVGSLERQLADLRGSVLARGGTGSAVGTEVVRSTSQTIPTSTSTLLIFSSASRDDEGLWDAGTPTRLTFITAGVYDVVCGVAWAVTSTAGLRQVSIRRNGSLRALTAGPSSPSFETVQQAVRTLAVSAGDYIDVALFQSSGGDLAVAPSSYSSWLAAWRR